jgi:hypothetical protein
LRGTLHHHYSGLGPVDPICDCVATAMAGVPQSAWTRSGSEAQSAEDASSVTRTLVIANRSNLSLHIAPRISFYIAEPSSTVQFKLVRTESGGDRRDHLRALAQCVEMDANEVRIMASKSVLFRTLVAVSSAKRASFGVPSFV